MQTWNKISLNRKIQRLLLGILCGLCLVLVVRSPTFAQSTTVNRAEITQILDSPQVFIQERLARVKDSASKGQRVRTAAARAQLLFNTGAVGRLAQNSVLTVGQQCARLQKGTLLINGAINGCASSVVAGVRGTTYLLEVTESDTANIKVLEGEVTVSPYSDASQPVNQNSIPFGTRPAPVFRRVETQNVQTASVILREGEKVSVRPDGNIGLVEKLSQDEFTQLLRGTLVSGFVPLPGISKVQGSFQKLFPGVPFPVGVPLLPRIPTPRIPIRLPF